MAEIKTYLTLVGSEFDVELVTKKIGMQPSTIRTQSELLRNGRTFGHTEWGLETELRELNDVEESLKDLMAFLDCDHATFLQLCEECSAEWHILILIRVFDGRMPTIVFSPQSIRFFASLNAHVGFDTYLL